MAHKKEVAKDKFQEAAHKKSQARQAAPEFEKDGRGERKQEAQAAWDAMANDYDELVAEIESLEEAVANADDDDGKTLREYEARCKEIEKTKEKVGVAYAYTHIHKHMYMHVHMHEMQGDREDEGEGGRCVCIHTHTHTRTCGCAYARARARTHTHLYACVYARIYAYTCALGAGGRHRG